MGGGSRSGSSAPPPRATGGSSASGRAPQSPTSPSSRGASGGNRIARPHTARGAGTVPAPLVRSQSTNGGKPAQVNQSRRRLVFAGEAIVDLLMWVPALPERGGDMLADSFSVQVGGGFNIMAAAARQGFPVVYAGGHGTGPWGDRVRAALTAEDIRILRTPDPDADTGFDVALVEAGGERTFVTSLGAETLREPGAWDLVRVRPGDAVYVSGYGLVAPGSGAMLGAWAAMLPPEALLFVDPGPLIADIPAAVLDPV